MNYDELLAGTIVKRKDRASNITFKYSGQCENRVTLDLFEDDKWVGNRVMYKNYFEEKFEVITVVEGEEDE
jgi:hypothetical protein